VKPEQSEAERLWKGSGARTPAEFMKWAFKQEMEPGEVIKYSRMQPGKGISKEIGKNRIFDWGTNDG